MLLSASRPRLVRAGSGTTRSISKPQPVSGGLSCLGGVLYFSSKSPFSTAACVKPFRHTASKHSKNISSTTDWIDFNLVSLLLPSACFALALWDLDLWELDLWELELCSGLLGKPKRTGLLGIARDCSGLLGIAWAGWAGWAPQNELSVSLLLQLNCNSHNKKNMSYSIMIKAH